jgi:hypothetical protein
MNLFKIITIINLFFYNSSIFSQINVWVEEHGAGFNLRQLSTSEYPSCEFLTNELYLDETLSDEFDSPYLNETKWGYNLPWGVTVEDGGATWMDPAEVHFENNNIKFGVNHIPRSNIPAKDQQGNTIYVNREYRAGAIYSKNAIQYGYYEISCKIPRITGHWPAFWFIGGCLQEIDVFEFRGYNSKSSTPFNIFGNNDALSTCIPHRSKWYIPPECASANPIFSMHSPVNNEPWCTFHAGQKRDIGTHLEYSKWDVKHTLETSIGCVYDDVEVQMDFHADFHTFGLSYNPLGVTWYIDGVPKITQNRYYKGKLITHYAGPHNGLVTSILKAPFSYNDLVNLCNGNFTDDFIYEQINFVKEEIPMGIIIGNGYEILPDFNHYNFVDNWFDWPEGYLVVNYFRAYKFSDCKKELTFCSNSDFSEYQNFVKAKKIILPNNCSFNYIASDLTLKATDDIIIEGEMSIYEGTLFSAEISLCENGSVQRSFNVDTTSFIDSLIINSSRSNNNAKNQNIVANDILVTNNLKHNIRLFPNPSDGRVSVTINKINFEKCDVKILNNYGALVYSNSFEGVQFTINLDVAPGLYLFLVKNGDICYKEKLIIK